MSTRARRISAVVLLSVASFIVLSAVLSGMYALPADQVYRHAARYVLTPVFRWWYQDDLDYVKNATSKYHVAAEDIPSGKPMDSWQRLQNQAPMLSVRNLHELADPERDVPFVYERSDEEYLRRFREKYHLDEIVKDAPDQYSAMLKVGEWLGTRFDHGADKLVGTSQVCDPMAIVEAGQKGAKYWCEIAARTMVHTAASMAWPARLISASRDGYTWEHALAELWSDQFGKWFVIDVDYNVVYERNGVPLSAFELSRDGPALQKAGLLRVRQIAPPKHSLPYEDMVPYYRYVHVDLRNDWCSRTLRRGSPAGGDLATWWTARPDMPRLLTNRIRVDDEQSFDWAVNDVSIYGVSATPAADGVKVNVALAAYSPEFQHFELRLDGQDWQRIAGRQQTLALAPGPHQLEARVVTKSGYGGPASQVELAVADHTTAATTPGAR